METEQKFYKSKKFILPLLSVLFIAGIVVAVALTQTTIFTAHGNESINILTNSIEIETFFAGQTICSNISVENIAPDVTYNVPLAWQEDSNPDGVEYTMNLPFNHTAIPGITEAEICLTTTTNSTIGTINGTISYMRE